MKNNLLVTLLLAAAVAGGAYMIGRKYLPRVQTKADGRTRYGADFSAYQDAGY